MRRLDEIRRFRSLDYSDKKERESWRCRIGQNSCRGACEFNLRKLKRGR